MRVRDHKMRNLVHQRDRGVCALCGCDCEQLDRVARMVATGVAKPAWGWNHVRPTGYAFMAYRDLLRRLGFRIHYRVRSLWQADHVMPFSHGGACSLENMRTLCLPCHEQETLRLTCPPGSTLAPIEGIA